MRTACLHQSTLARCPTHRPHHIARVSVAQPLRLVNRRHARLFTAARSAEESTSEASTEEAVSEGRSGPIQRVRDIWEDMSVDSEDMANAIADAEAEAADLHDRLSAGDQRIVSLEGTVTQAKDQLMRLGADFDNYRKRTASEKDALSVSVKGEVVKQLLPLVDNFELARTQVKAETEGEQKINNAYQGLYKQMVDMMRSLGVEPVDTMGSIFDPNLHDAIMREPNDDVPEGTVLQEFRKGFRIGDRLLRPAMVKVSFSDAVPAAGAVAEGEEAEAAEESA